MNIETMNPEATVETQGHAATAVPEAVPSTKKADYSLLAAPVRGGLFHTAALRDLAPRGRLAARRLGPAGLAGAALLLVAAIMAVAVVRPVHQQATNLQGQLTALDSARATMRDQARSPADQAGEFLGRFPNRAELPAVLAAFGAAANKAGVTLEQGTYTLEAQKSASLARYVIDLPVKGSYPAIRQFISDTLVTVPAASLDTLRLERREVGEGAVEAGLRFTVFVRSTP